MHNEQYIVYCILIARKLNRNGITLRTMGDETIACSIIGLAHRYIDRARFLRGK